MATDRQLEKKSFLLSRPYLFYLEVFVLIGFVALAALHIRRGGAQPEPLSQQPDSLLAEADAHFDKQDLSPALRLYWQALQAFVAEKSEANAPARLHANLRIAEIYSQSNWLKDAKARLEYAARIQPEHGAVRLLRGKLFRNEGLLEEATEEFLAVVENNPNHAEAHYLLGVLYQGNRQFKQAAARYRRAIESDPNLQNVASEKAPIGILARLQLSRTYNRMLQSYITADRELTPEDFKEIARLETQAILRLEQALEKWPTLSEITDDLIRLLYVRAKALEREGATRPYADALQVYERIVELDPEELGAWERMAEIYYSYLGNKRKALEIYRKVYELSPHPSTLANVKSLERELGIDTESTE